MFLMAPGFCDRSSSGGDVFSKVELCRGEVQLKGKGFPVRIVMEHMKAGETAKQIIERYPSLSLQDIEVCHEYASRVAREASA